jgi:hypothetical protein
MIHKSWINAPPIAHRDLSSFRSTRALHHWIEPPSTTTSALADAALWFGVAIGLRLCAERLMASGAMLGGVLTVVLLISPAIGLTYLSCQRPDLSPVLMYRMVLIMAGLLLGGRV